MYNYNNFWSVTEQMTKTHFVHDCESLSFDKQINQENMDYKQMSYSKAQLRAKDLKIRHILDNRSDVNIITHFVLVENQKSYL